MVCGSLLIWHFPEQAKLNIVSIFTHEPKKRFGAQVAAKQMIAGYYEISRDYQRSEFHGTHKKHRRDKSCWNFFFMNNMLQSNCGI